MRMKDELPYTEEIIIQNGVEYNVLDKNKLAEIYKKYPLKIGRKTAPTMNKKLNEVSLKKNSTRSSCLLNLLRLV
ncbi:MAG: hypothetical protein IJV31_07930 [Clostridia bacterium]|nr:hypothetical protein [Clostridia bacterium]